jgi:hypothetical protein
MKFNEYFIMFSPMHSIEGDWNHNINGEAKELVTLKGFQ